MSFELAHCFYTVLNLFFFQFIKHVCLFVCLSVFEVIFPEPIIVNGREVQEPEGVFIKILC